jgi:hypothetical protein
LGPALASSRTVGRRSTRCPDKLKTRTAPDFPSFQSSYRQFKSDDGGPTDQSSRYVYMEGLSSNRFRSRDSNALKDPPCCSGGLLSLADFMALVASPPPSETHWTSRSSTFDESPSDKKIPGTAVICGGRYPHEGLGTSCLLIVSLVSRDC